MNSTQTRRNSRLRFVLLSLATVASMTLVSTLIACQQTNSQSINATQIPQELAAHQALLLDVRTPDEYNSGHVSTAILAPHSNIGQTIASIAPDKNQKIYVHCRSGHRSSLAFDTLKSMGYTNVVNLGGLNDLAQYGLTIGK